MCDCYEAECEKKGCTEEIPIHIADYDFPREDVQAYCSKHLPKKKATLFEVIEECKNFKDKEVGWKCAIRLCNGRIEPDSVGVYPNSGAKFKTCYLK